MSRCLIFANGHLPDLQEAHRLVGSEDVVIAANGGTRHALALGLIPSVIIGDLDSIADELQTLQAGGAQVFQHPRDKNETDLELALTYALEQGQTEIVILGALGGRLDQTLGNLALLADPRLSGREVRLDDGVEEVFLCRAHARVQGRSGDLVSLIPWGGEVHGVRTEGLRWPLFDEPLFAHKTRGLSNEMTAEQALIWVRSGTLLVVHRRSSSAFENPPKGEQP